MEEKTTFKSGFVAVVGRPNVGKSTLINRIIKQKVSIVSDKAQTTRNRILCIHTDEDCQIVFLDTPGIHKPKHKLGQFMDEAAYQSLKDIDAVLFLISGNEKKGPGDMFVLDKVKDAGVPVFLIINKVDLMKERDALLPLMAQSMQKFPFAAIVPVCAEKGKQVSELMAEIEKLLPENPPFFDPDIYTDKSPRFLAAEIIREKAFRLLGDELPYGIAVTIDKWVEDDKRAEIIATLIVEREAHKGIVIGAQGEKLREISRLARADIAEMLGKNVYLEVWVRVRKGWNDDARALKSLGYE